MVQDNATDDLFVGGNTTSTNFPTLTPRQATRGGTQAGFLQNLNGAGATQWSSYFSSDASNSASSSAWSSTPRRPNCTSEA